MLSPRSVLISALIPGNGSVADPGFVFVMPRQRRDHDRARLCLPPCVYDGTSLAADVAVIPDPGFRIDRLADGSEEPQAGEVATRRPLGPPPHERANRSWRGVEDRDAVALDDLPEAILAGPVRCALIHQDGRAVCQRPIDDVAVTGDPADVRGAPIHIVFLQIEDPLRRRIGADKVAASRVDDPLRLTGGARGVEDVEHVLCIHLLGLTVVSGVEHQAVIPVVAPFLDVDFHRRALQPLHDDDVFD